MAAHALWTDLYQLTMAAGYFHRGLADTVATCEMFVRGLPRQRRYLVAAGIDTIVERIASLRFTNEQIEALAGLPALADAMTDDFRRYLADFRFRGELHAVREGRVMYAGAPFIRVVAPIIEAQLVETLLLSTVNHATMIASKAARIVRAAGERSVLEFGTRRTHPAAALDAARVAYLVGAVGTSNVAAGLAYDIPVLGTAAHMWTMTHDTEEEAFANYVATFPNACTLLIDTYDTVRGAARAARIAKDKLAGVRLDSGDLCALAKAVRKVLDESGCAHARIVASGDLNEHKITELIAAGAPIDSFGVGTELVCSKDAPSLGGVYKVVQFERAGRTVPIAKLSEGKATYPGPHQVFRRENGDVLGLADEDLPGEPLLEARIEGGEVVGGQSLTAARAATMAELAALSAAMHSLEPGQDRGVIPISDGVRGLLAGIRAEKGGA